MLKRSTSLAEPRHSAVRWSMPVIFTSRTEPPVTPWPYEYTYARLPTASGAARCYLTTISPLLVRPLLLLRLATAQVAISPLLVRPLLLLRLATAHVGRLAAGFLDEQTEGSGLEGETDLGRRCLEMQAEHVRCTYGDPTY